MRVQQPVGTDAMSDNFLAITKEVGDWGPLI